MKPILAIALRCTLALTMVAGGLPAWAMEQAPDADPIPGSQAVSDQSAPNHGESDACHSPSTETGDDPTPADSQQDCCNDDDCGHDNCGSICPALSIVLPVRAANTGLSAAGIAPSTLNTLATQPVVTTLLRPPRA